jgi:hypothetical protein
LYHYERQNWKQAADGFREAFEIKADDHPSKMYIERCLQFTSNSPGYDWDGVFNLTSN